MQTQFGFFAPPSRAFAAMSGRAQPFAELGRTLHDGVWIVERAVRERGPARKADGFLCAPPSCPEAERSVKTGRAFPASPDDVNGFVVEVSLPNAWSSLFRAEFARGVLDNAGATLPSAIRNAGKRGGRSLLLLVFSDAAAAERARAALNGACAFERASWAEAAFWTPATA